MTHEQRVFAYRNQVHSIYRRHEENLTPAQRRRIVKKARRDVLKWAKSKPPLSTLPPSNATFDACGSQFSLRRSAERKSKGMVLVP